VNGIATGPRYQKGRFSMLNAVAITPSRSRKEGKQRVESLQPTPTPRALAVGMPSDEELIARVCWREEPALGTIYDRYHRLIFSIALRVVGDRDLAEEVVQDVFQAVWVSASSFQPDGSFSAWLVGIARHRAIDATRTRRFRARAREDMLDDARLAPASQAHEAGTDALMLRTVMRAALAQLPPAQRQAIELGYYGGLTHAEIAARLGEPVGTIKSRVRMGLLKLRELLESEGA
jgi:RNA polymerase sigma-70 factor (ECF subfamily)